MPEIKLKKIQPNRLNPRLEFSKYGLDELADSIKHVGIIEPIIVRPANNDTYEVVVGERRYRAAQQAGLETVPVIIRDYTDEQLMELNLIENIQREDLSGVEKGKICQQLLERFSERYPNQASLAKGLGIRSTTTITSWLQAAGMPIEIQKRIAPETFGRVPIGKVDYRTATMVARKVKEPERAIEVVEGIAERGVTRQAAIRVARQATSEPNKPVEAIIKQVVERTPIFLPFSKAHANAIVQGEKSQTARKSKDPRLVPGATVRVQVTHYADVEITDVNRKRLGDFDEEDARREGGYTLDEFKGVWQLLHDSWNPDEVVYVVRFKLVKVMGEEPKSS